MTFSFEVELKDCWIGETFTTRAAIVLILLFVIALLLFCLILRVVLGINFRDRRLPAEETALFPFTFEHFLRLLGYFTEVYKRL